MAISVLQPSEFSNLVRNAAARKQAVKAGQAPASLTTSLTGQTVAMMFSKRSTRTRVSTEAAVTMLGGHPMFLGKDDIQLGVSKGQPYDQYLGLTVLRRSMSLYMTRLLSFPQ